MNWIFKMKSNLYIVVDYVISGFVYSDMFS